MCRVSREGKKAEAGKERRQRGTKEEEHKRERERERDEKSLPRGKLFVDAFPSSRLPSSLVNDVMWKNRKS